MGDLTNERAALYKCTSEVNTLAKCSQHIQPTPCHCVSSSRILLGLAGHSLGDCLPPTGSGPSLHPITVFRAKVDELCRNCFVHGSEAGLQWPMSWFRILSPWLGACESVTKCLPPLSLRCRRRRSLPLPRMGSRGRIGGVTLC